MALLQMLGAGLKHLLGGGLGAAIRGGLASTATQMVSKGVQNVLSSGSQSSAMGQQSAGWSLGGESSLQQSAYGEQGSTSGIANALTTALSTPTGNNAVSAAGFNAAAAQTANDLQSKWWNNAAAFNMMNTWAANAMSAASQSSARRFNAEQAELSRAWSKDMRATAYQDTMKDMKAAGLNPILAAFNGATGTPNGASASSGATNFDSAQAPSAPIAHVGSMQAMYDYGNNTSQFIDNMLSTISNAKQFGYNNVAYQLERAMTDGASTSAQEISRYANESKSRSQTKGKQVENHKEMGGEVKAQLGKTDMMDAVPYGYYNGGSFVPMLHD